MTLPIKLWPNRTFKNNQIQLVAMNFQCKELTISDEELGFALTFSDSKSEDRQYLDIDVLINSEEKYLLIQRTYPEDEFEDDYYYIESSESERKLGCNDKMTVKLSREDFEISWSGDQLKIGLDLTDTELNELKEIFQVVFKERIILKT